MASRRPVQSGRDPLRCATEGRRDHWFWSSAVPALPALPHTTASWFRCMCSRAISALASVDSSSERWPVRCRSEVVRPCCSGSWPRARPAGVLRRLGGVRLAEHRLPWENRSPQRELAFGWPGSKTCTSWVTTVHAANDAVISNTRLPFSTEEGSRETSHRRAAKLRAGIERWAMRSRVVDPTAENVQ